MMWTVIDDPDIGVQYQDSVAALWAGGEAQNLGLLPYGYYSWATAINNNGQVVGYGNWVNSDDGSAGISALLWSQGGMQSLGTLPGGSYSIATGINNEGQVIGWSDGVAPSTFLWSSETGMQPLAPLPGGNSTGPFGMNDSRQVVGWSNVEDQFDSHVVLWTDGKIVDLTTLPEVLGAGWSLSAASGINNAGQIVGMGTLMVGGTTGGEPASFLLSPGEAGLSAKTAGPCPPAGQGATDDPNRPNRCDPGNPINAATGNKYQIETDYVGAGVHPLIFQRYYNSATGFSTGVIGAHWRHSYERSIIWRGNTAVVMRPDGKQYVFRQSGPDWVGDPDVMDSLSRTDSSWTYTTAPSNEVETYDASGQLMSISDRAGITQRLDRDPHGRLLSVTHLLTGARLVFVYDSLGDIAAISDPAGNTFTYAYEDSDLTSVTYPGNMPAPADPPVRTYIYNEPQNTSGLNRPHYLTGIIDEKGSRFATYQYDIQGRGISTQHAGGAGAYTIAYNSDGTSSVTDPLSKTRTYTFQTLFQVPRDTGLDQPCLTCGMASATAYDGNGFLSSATNFNHVTTTYSHNARGLEVRRTEASGTTLARSISTAWHPSFRLPVQIAGPQRITTFSYDDRGTLTSKTIQPTSDADGSQGFNAAAAGSARTWTYMNTYSSVTPGLLIQQVVDGPRTDVADLTTYVWDELGNLISVTNALGQTSTLSNYDAHGRARQVTDPNGLVTTLAYDVRGRLISRNVGGELTSYAYDPAGQLVQVTAPDGSWLGYTHDAAHRLIKIQDNLGDQIVYTLDAMGNRVQEQVLDANGTLAVARSSAYNSLDRLAQSIGGAKPATEVTSYGYDAQGNLTSVTDPLGHLTSNLYDALNRLTQVISPSASGSASGATVQYQYDGLDQITQVTDPRSLATRYSLDGLGNLTQLQSPDSGATSSSYDAAGNLISQTDARGVTGTFRYDALNRMTQAVYAPPAGSNIAAVTLLYSYDQGAFGIGHLTGMSDPGGTTAYSYDQRGRLIQDQHGVGGATYAVSYSYDSFGRLSRITYPSGRTLNYGFDTLGRVRQIDTSYQGTTQSVVSNVAYQPFGAAVSFSFGNAQGYSRSYDLDGRVTGYNLGASSRTLSYDAASRLTSVSTPNAALNQSYGYD
ncbi:MAG TPA: DUF6531 domain-containing protein, partial [Burkholderiales bacterium]|nr:DUF6531 domain-containing protein [Burkholderiales bacterium]